MNSPRFIRDDWPLRAFHADDPYNRLWRELFHFAGHDAAREVIRSPDGNVFERFRNAIKLADEFIAEYEEGGNLVDVVPLYYGSLWLGLAMAFCTLGPNDIGSASGHHGLKAANLDKWPFKLTEAFVEPLVQTGSCSIINRALGGDDICGIPFKLLDLLRAIPHLDNDLEKVESGTSAFRLAYDPTTLAVVHEGRTVEGCVFPRTPGKISSGWVNDHLAVSDYLMQSQFQILDVPSRRVRWTPANRETFAELEQVLIDAPSGKYFLPKLRGKVVPEYVICLMVLYALSSLARYYPDVWVAMWEQQTHEIFILRSFVYHAQRTVPRLALNHLTKRTNVPILH